MLSIRQYAPPFLTLPDFMHVQFLHSRLCSKRRIASSHELHMFAAQARSAGVADRLLWVDGFQTSEALSSLLMCSAAFLAPFDEQSPTSVNPSCSSSLKP